VTHDEKLATPPPALDQEADEALFERVRAGEVVLFELLMRRHNQRLFRVARAIVKDADEAEDVMQEAYVRAFEHRDQFEGRARFSTWLVKIAVHEAQARRRRRARVGSRCSLEEAVADESMIEALGKASQGPQDIAASRELAGLLEAAIDRLPESQRVVFVLREVEGLDTRETAQCVGLTEEAVKVRLHRARQSLRQDLERRLSASARDVYGFHLSRCDRVVARVLERIRSS
jgi:RNA polymerase sigma-70 factor (ECF subfamily)